MSEKKQFILIGHPVSHSVSPQIHGAAYAARGVDAEYALVDCPDEESVRAQVERIRQRELTGANITVPHKHLALSLADRQDSTAEQTGVANVLLRDADGALVAYNTDASALAEELAEAKSRDAALIIGNGGAALAAVVACRSIGVTDIFVTARRFTKELAPSDYPHAGRFLPLGARLVIWPGADAAPLADLAGQIGIVVQATSAGMKGVDSGDAVAQVVPWTRLPKGALAYDVVYNPPQTPFLQAAERQGLRAKGGLGMLVGQAARAFSLWFDEDAPTAEMHVAAHRAIFPDAS